MSTTVWTRAITVVLVSYVTMKEPMINKKNITAGDTFTITCDVKRMDYVDEYIDKFQYMSINRLQNGQVISFLASYEYTRLETKIWKDKTLGRNIDLVYSGGNMTRNRDTMQIVLTVRDACCSDAGEFECRLMAQGRYDGDVQFNRKDAVICEEPIVQGELTSGLSNKVGDTAVLTCTFVGERNLNATWKISRTKSESKYPIQRHISNNIPQQTYNCGGCQVYFYITRLTFTIESSEHDTTYICVVMQGNVEKSRKSLMLSVDEETDNGRLKLEPRLINIITIYTCVVFIVSVML